MHVVVRSALAGSVLLAWLGCGGSPPPAKSGAAAPTSSAPPTTTTTAAVAARTTQIHRSEVRQAIGRGLGVFLQNVSLEDLPAMDAGRFHGWRLRAINPALGVDLRPGDVVTRVNGMPIEHPEEADAALRSLERARSLRVDYEREGKSLVLDLPIVDD